MFCIIYLIEASEILEIKENSPGIDNDFEKAFYNTVRRYFVFAILSEPANITDDWFAVDCYFLIGLDFERYLSSHFFEFSFEFELYYGDGYFGRGGDGLKFYGISTDHFICGMVVWKD